MKKRLLVLPLVGAFLLSGCDFMDTIKGWFSPKSQNQDTTPSNNKPKGNDDDIPELVVDHTPQIKEEYEGYRLVKTPEEGKRYILGAYRHKIDKMRFFNGDYHSDSKGKYPYYLGTDVDSTEGAAQIEIKFLEGSTTEFTIQVFTPDDETKPYNEKYLGLYTGLSNYGKLVTSFAQQDDASDTEYKDPVKEDDKIFDDVKTTFTFSEKCTQVSEGESKEVDVYAPCIWFQKKTLKNDKGEDVPGDSEAHLIFIGTTINSENYTSFDSEMVDTAIDGGAYDLAHFYEKIEA